MMITVYRGDSRAPEVIKSNGFAAQNPRSLDEIRADLLSYCKPPKSPLDLSRLIISSPQKEYISTDPSEDCGGYSGKGYIYKIVFDDLKERQWTREVLGDNTEVKINNFTPKLYLNAERLSDASLIALQHYGTISREVTFLTAIPKQNIIQYKQSAEKGFHDM